jgi:hypothetical protein
MHTSLAKKSHVRNWVFLNELSYFTIPHKHSHSLTSVAPEVGVGQRIDRF